MVNIKPIDFMSEHRLSEIVIERPRWGMRISSTRMTGYQKELDRITKEATEDGLLSPYRIKVRRKSKWLSDNLGPLKRFLRSNLNQPWSDVYSRLCKELDPRTMAGQHIIDHLWDFVALHVEMRDGIPYVKPNGCFCNGYYPLTASYRKRFYVHPDNGLLCGVPRVCQVQTPEPPKAVDRIKISAYVDYRLIDNLWYRITFAALTSDFAWDVLLREQIDRQKALLTYRRSVYAVKKHQCSKKELRIIRNKIG